MNRFKSILQKLFHRGRKESSVQPTLTMLLERIFRQHSGTQSSGLPEVKAVSFEYFEGALNNGNFYTAEYKGSEGVTRAVLAVPAPDRAPPSQKLPTGNEDPGAFLSKIPPRLVRLFFIPEESSPGITAPGFHLILPILIQEQNSRNLLRQAEGSEILAVRGVYTGEAFLLAEQELFESLKRQYSQNRVFAEIVDEFVFDTNSPAREEEKTITVTVAHPEEFTAGRFFLPKVISQKPELILSRFLEASATNDGGFFKEARGLWFRVSLKSREKNYPFFYFFDSGKQPQSRNQKDVFRRLFRLILKKTSDNFKNCGVQIDGIQGVFDQVPKPEELTGSILLKFRIESAKSVIQGYNVIPLSLPAFILEKIQPPRRFNCSAGDLPSRLNLLFTLNTQLLSNGRMEVYEREPHEEKIVLSAEDPLGSLRKKIIKLNELLELLTLREARTIISNLLYRKGWTGESLRKIFYFREYAGENQEGRKVYVKKTIVGFDEPRFRTFLMRNMLDQWQNPKNTGESYEKGLLSHFTAVSQIYSELKNGKYFTPSPSLRSLLTAEFNFYQKGLKQIAEGLSRDRSFLEYKPPHVPELTLLFNGIPTASLLSLFRYVPEDLGTFKPVLAVNRCREIVQHLKKLTREPDDRDIEEALNLRSRILEILTSPPEDN